MKVVVARADFPSLAIEERILSRVGAEVVDARALAGDEAVEACADADGVLSDYVMWDAAALARLERCRVICLYGVGLDRIDVEAATARGILVTHTPEYCVDEVADHTLGLLLAVARRIGLYDRHVRAGGWSYNVGGPLHRLRGRTLGLVGFGRVGAAVAERARAFGMEVAAFDPFVPADRLAKAKVAAAASLGELLAKADAVSLHLPLTDETRGLIGRRELAAMRPAAILVNTARGGLVDQEALADAVASGRLGGAGLDVLPQEPPPPGERLLALPTVVVTPHAAFLSEESVAELQTTAAEEVALALTGSPPRYLLNREALAQA